MALGVRVGQARGGDVERGRVCGFDGKPGQPGAIVLAPFGPIYMPEVGAAVVLVMAS
jgi:hypothetical protein